MSAPTVTRAQAARRATQASVIGTTIEWYDFFLYGTAAALVFPQLFFPGGQDSFNGVIAAFGTQFVGFVARPVGAAIFGHFGDRIGRKTTLMVTLFLMAVGTVLIGLLPTYQAIGVWAPILLTLLRIVQGIGVGGEWGGSVLIAMEWGHQERRGLAASWPQLGVPLGLVLSTGVVRLVSGITGSDFLTYGWRIPFILSIVLIGVGLFVRMRVIESPEFEAVRKKDNVVTAPILEAIRRQPKQILLSALVRTSEQAPFYLFITFVITYTTKHLKFSSDAILVDTLIAAAIGLISIPVFGRLSDRFGRKLVYGIGIVATAVYAFPYFGLLNTGDALMIGIAVVVSLILHDIQYGPQAALIAESFDPDIRYTGAGLGYQLASVIAGGPAPLIAAALLQGTGGSTAISVYIIICAVISVIALVLLPRARPATAVGADPVDEATRA
ncbi:MFS transporter [Tersicoccus sp. Bi-70]|uniref:MFS transporter n=1 Tax=Tersicoccus sp. Bi-70 TaxID=1897634 RepID=UPI0009757499|nr:MFS transporter [Tersicoccus sp. Bi-70]OMH37026.1 MFS transporter [Tersicoccus sp. Bi-70]